MPQIQSYESLSKSQLIEIILQKQQEIEDLQAMPQKAESIVCVFTDADTPLEQRIREFADKHYLACRQCGHKKL